jgi:hypothetical protein
MLYDHLRGQTRRLVSILLVTAIAIVFGISFVFSIFAAPVHDDFCRAALDVNWLDNVKQNYQTWSGRWAVHALYGATFPSIDITSINYNILLSFCLPLWFCIFYILIGVCIGNALPRSKKAGFALILCSAYWVGMPKVAETWYWLTGDAEYNVPFFLFSVLIYVLTLLLRQGSYAITKAASAICSIFLVFVIGGFNELVSLLLIPTVAAGCFVLVAQRRYSDAKLFGVILTFGIVGFAVNFFAPGTAGHAASLANHYSFRGAIEAAFFRVGSFPLDWFLDSRFLCLSLLLLTSPSFVQIEPAWTRVRIFGLSPLFIIPAIGAIIIFSVWFCVAFAQGGGTLAGRVLNILYAFFIFVWLASIIAAAGRIRDSQSQANGLIRGINIVAGVLFPLSLLVSPTMISSVFELRYVILPWHQAVLRRDAYIHNKLSEGIRRIEVDPIAQHPSMYSWEDLESQQIPWNIWRNECFAKYYGAERISIKK